MQLPKPIDDGLEIPSVGAWSREKHHFLARYIDAFTTAMRKKAWSGLHYIDLFAGAGIERLEKSGELDWGSALVAARARFPFTRLHLCEQNAAKYEALRQRIRTLRPQEDDQVIQGDANVLVDDVVRSVPPRSLSLAFLDPYGLHLDFQTLRRLSQIRADLIIVFPDKLDIIRNWDAYYWDNPNSNLDAVLGPDSNWRKVILECASSARLEAFRKLYIAQIRLLGYEHFEFEAIPGTTTRLYWLIFCSRSKTGAKIWQGVSAIKPGGQRSFDF